MAGCGAHHVSMQDAVLRFVCGDRDRCNKNVQVELSAVRRVDDYATAEVSSKPAGRTHARHVLLKRVDGDWQFVDGWASLAGLECADVARQMRVRESILRRLGACG